MSGGLQAFHLPGAASAGGHRMALYRSPGTDIRGAVLHVHAFAEEMNKSRRMVALASRALAQQGFAVLQIDLFGCGDSSGSFVDASWQHWIDDVVSAAQWLGSRHQAPLWLWGHRAGCLIALAAARHIPGAERFLFWQPQTSGKLVLQQFLRLQMINEMQRSGGKGVTEALRRELEAGRAVDVAGYTLPSELALGLERTTLTPPVLADRGHLVWLEATSRTPETLLPASEAALAQWAGAGFVVHSRAVSGPAFWQTLEIEEAPSLVEATASSLAACVVDGQEVA